jgi:hypothetical protein
MTAEGIHDMTAEDYHSGATDEPSLSASIAKILLQQSPLHDWYAHPRLNPQYEPTHTDRFDLGTAAHALLLEGERFSERVATIDAADWRTNAAKTHKAAAREAGYVPLLESDWRRVIEMVNAVRDQLSARDDDPPLFADGKPEQTLIWRENGVLCRARLDWLHDDLRTVDDLKTSGQSANPVDYSRRTFWSIGADVQARFYARGIKALTGDYPAFRFCVIETTAPFCLSVLDLAPSTVELADQKIDRALELWKRCLESGEFPGYPSGIASVEVTWQEADHLARHWEAAA